LNFANEHFYSKNSIFVLGKCELFQIFRVSDKTLRLSLADGLDGGKKKIVFEGKVNSKVNWNLW